MIEVWRNPDFLNIWDQSNFDIQKCVKVADVDTDNLDVAYKLTNSIHSHWSDNRDSFLWINPISCVDVNDSGDYWASIDYVRSTSVGDFMKMDDKWYMVDSFGFKELV